MEINYGEKEENFQLFLGYDRVAMLGDYLTVL